MESRDKLHEESMGDNRITSTATKALFLDKVRQSNIACQAGDFKKAVSLYSEAIVLDSKNHILYSNRSAAYVKLGRFKVALADAIKAKTLNPEWSKAYYREGVALQCLGNYAEAISAFSTGLALDPKSVPLLNGLVEAAIKSPLKAKLERTYNQLETMKLDKSPFVVMSVIGQELLAQNNFKFAVIVLENALQIGTCSHKLRGSVFSALSSACWAMNSLDKAIDYMQQDLSIAKSLSDIEGEYRAHGNLGSAYFSKGNFKEALTSHRYQLVLAMKCRDNHVAASALTNLGHVYTSISDYPNALASHQQCLELVRSLGDSNGETREIGNIGAVYLAMGEFDRSIEIHTEHLELAKKCGNKTEQSRAHCNLGTCFHYKKDFERSKIEHAHVLELAKCLGDKMIEGRAYAGLGHAERYMGNYGEAKEFYQKQLEMALALKDKVSEGQSCSNLGIVFHVFNDHDAAIKLHQAHLSIAKELDDRPGMGRAYGNIGNVYAASGLYEDAITYYHQELTIAQGENDRNSEAVTHGNLAVSYQALSVFDMALAHYHSHLSIARELSDTSSESCALSNIGSCFSSMGEFEQAIPFYENHLILCQKLGDLESETKACHFLGYAHYRLQNHKEAIGYYEEEINLSREQTNQSSLGKAYCNLGLAQLSLGNNQEALDCQKRFLVIAQSTQERDSVFRALDNVGNVLMKMEEYTDAIKVFMKQLTLAKNIQDLQREATAYGSLGICHRLLKRFDTSLAYHTQELSILQDSSNSRGECQAHANLGSVHLALSNYTDASKCYSEQLDIARELEDKILEANALGNLGNARLSLGRYEEAAQAFEEEQTILASLTNIDNVEMGRSLRNLGACHKFLGEFHEAIECHERQLSLCLKNKAFTEQTKVYAELGTLHRSLGNYKQALVCFEKRLVTTAHDKSNITKSTYSAYEDLAGIHVVLGNFEQAIACVEHQIKLMREYRAKSYEVNALGALGCIYHQMNNWNMALGKYQCSLQMALDMQDKSATMKAYLNLGLGYEAMDEIERAISFFEHLLKAAINSKSYENEAKALYNLGRIQYNVGNFGRCVNYLVQSLSSAAELGRNTEIRARIHHRLGLGLWKLDCGEEAISHLKLATSIVDVLRQSQVSSFYNVTSTDPDSRISLFDVQLECTQVLQRIFVDLGQYNEALVSAENGRSKVYGNEMNMRFKNQLEAGNRCSVATFRDIINIVDRQKTSVLYFSSVLDYLYSWLILPNRGVVKFHKVFVNTGAESILDQNIDNITESLGVTYDEDMNDDLAVDGPKVASKLESLGNQLNQECDRTGFLRMVNRSSKLNASSYSLSSLFSVESAGGGSTTTGLTHTSIKSRRRVWNGPTCLNKLYELLLEPMEDDLPESFPTELTLVLNGNLFMVPFAMLKSPNSTEYFCEKYSLLMTSSLHAMKLARNKANVIPKLIQDPVNLLAVGNPNLPITIATKCGWVDIPQSSREADSIAEIFHTEALTEKNATKKAIIERICQADVLHFACHISWKLSAIIVSIGTSNNEAIESKTYMNHPNTKIDYSVQTDTILEEDEASSSSMLSSTVGDDWSSNLGDFLITAADILQMKLKARLVVLSSCYTRSVSDKLTADGFISLTRSLLASGCQCVVASLWPVPDMPVKIIMKSFYSSLLQGSRASKALAEAMATVQATKCFQHPLNWAGFVILGSDIKLSNKVALMGQAIRDIISQQDHCKNALRVTLHLVEKSLQRIQRGCKNAMYTSQKSIENKIGASDGWKDLLISVGFRFEPASNGIPASVFFPQNDPAERLTQCSACLQAILGLSHVSWSALAKLLLVSSEAADEIIAMFRHVVVSLKEEVSYVDIPVDVKLWQVPGCHELLASLGFDLMEVGKVDVILRTGKSVNKRQIHFALQALLAIFDTQEAQRSIDVDNNDTDVYDDGETKEQEVEPVPFAKNSLHSGELSAFSSYVRNRGEPDGRQSTKNDSPPALNDSKPLNNNYNKFQVHSQARKFEDVNKIVTPSEEHDVMHKHAANNRHMFTPTSQLWTSKSRIHKHDSQISHRSSSSNGTECGNGLDIGQQRRYHQHRSNEYEVDTPSPRLYVNSREVEYTSQQPAGRPAVPIRSVFTDVGYQTKLKLKDSSDPNDKFSVRTETRKISNNKNEPISCDVAKLKPGVIMRVPPTGESNSPGSTLDKETNPSKDEGNRRRRLMERETPLSDGVFHDRNFGLGLAPSLSNIIFSDNLQVVHVDHHSDSDSSSIKTTLATPSANIDTNIQYSTSSCQNGKTFHKFKTPNIDDKKPLPKIRPLVHPKPIVGSNFDGVWSSFNARDDGDGRSMTDSQYSGYSPNGHNHPSLGRHQAKSKNNDNGSLTAQVEYLKFKDYINDQEITVLEEKDVNPTGKGKYNSAFLQDDENQVVASDSRRPNVFEFGSKNSKRIGNEGSETVAAVSSSNNKNDSRGLLWSRDKNGTLTYNGMLASDC